MLLYHTSQIEVTHPMVSCSRRYLDFGQGFYLTRLEKQARKYGNRFLREGLDAVLNIYELDDDIPRISRMEFKAYDDEWLEYVNLARHESEREYFDIIEGGIADDDVFNTLNLYWDGLMSREAALGELAKKEVNHQICICSQEVIDRHLHFIESIKL